MQHLQIQFPDREDLKELLREVKQELSQDVKRLQKGQAPIVEYLTREEVAKKYRISLPTLNKHTNAGLPSIKIGKRRLYDSAAVSNYFLEKNKK